MRLSCIGTARGEQEAFLSHLAAIAVQHFETGPDSQAKAVREKLKLGMVGCRRHTECVDKDHPALAFKPILRTLDGVDNGPQNVAPDMSEVDDVLVHHTAL